ncbi:MAG: hypothetical protein A3G71_07295 [Gammaproteobacteria bacterium RIFCSPLOWO2_12_FULL_38_14]|nr:MAG: hypothetical protein A2W47_07175 [Gammaproteobacteria bacterium RIFCSPHIGHO2_12_38_15]OGT76513.1 MAG: hypothetical protein A3G71_07295 [Gammaproteobacteria bacterium RIFCSPLOWO2_12_FULL_38_14]
MTLIHAEGLCLQFNEKIILKNFSFSIHPGEFVAVLGPNGAGKSTLLKLILGLTKPTQGYLNVLGESPYQGHPHIGYLPQNRTIFSNFELTGYQLLASSLHANRLGLPLLSKNDKEKIKMIIAKTGAEKIAYRPFSSLSGGERQCLLLAQTLLNDPKILLLDEPLNNLDPYYQETLVELISNLSKELHMAVLLTAHDVNALLPALDRVLYMVGGVAKLGKLDDIITSRNLSALYDTPIEVLHYKNRVFVLGKHRSMGDFHQHCNE